MQGRVSIGHPVDVATGHVYAIRKDFSAPGSVPLLWERRYSTSLLAQPSTPLGHGWTTRYFAALSKRGTDFVLRTPEGGLEVLADPDALVERGGTLRNLGIFQELIKRGTNYIVTRWDVTSYTVERYIFTPHGTGDDLRLVGIEDETGDGLDLVRDTQGRLTGIRQRNERRTLQLNYTSTGRVESVTFVFADHRPRLVAMYDYDTAGRLITASDVLSYADRYEYDQNGRLTREILKDGGIFTFSYDRSGRCVKSSGLDRYDEKSFRYLDALNWTIVTDSTGAMTQYYYTATGQVMTEIDPLGAKRQTEYDEHGRIVAMTDPRGGTRRYEYDVFGNRCRTTDPLDQEWSVTFDDAHRPTTGTEPNGATWTRVYQRDHRLIAILTPLGTVWRFAYDAAGNLTTVVDPGGGESRRLVTEGGLRQDITDAAGRTTVLRYDPCGRVIERVEPSRATTLIAYDAAGNATRVDYPDGYWVEATYDPGGNVTSLTDSARRVLRQRYGPCRRLLERVDYLGLSTKYRWGSEPRRLEAIVRPRGDEHRFYYDAAGRLVREVGSSGRELSFTYDVAGECVGVTNARGQRTTYIRDLNSNVVKEMLSNGDEATFEYDHAKRLVAAVNRTCAVTFVRDALGRVVRETQGDVTVDSEYDSGGRLLRTRTSLGHEVTYSHDGTGQLSRVTAGGFFIDFVWDGDRNNIHRRFPGRLGLDQGFDARGRLTAQRLWRDVPDGNRRAPHGADRARRTPESDLVTRHYERDSIGAVTSIVDSSWGRDDFAYDAAEQLIRAHGAHATETYGYDSNGNINSIHRLDGTDEEWDISGNGDRLLASGPSRYEYDEDGRLTVSTDRGRDGPCPPTWRFAWDDNDQLRSVTRPDGEVWRYSYDALGRRVAKAGMGKTVRFIWDRAHLVHDLVGDAVRSWVFDPVTSIPICFTRGPALYSFITDHLGTPREIIASDGELAWSASYRPWGQVAATGVAKTDCPLRFAGQWYDDESGLHYTRFRYYDPHVARFISEDPIGVAGGEHLYRYVKNPVNWIDPFGLVNAGDLKKLTKRDIKNVDVHAMKKDLGVGSETDLAKDVDGNIFLVPRQKRADSEPQPTGLKVDDLPEEYPKNKDSRDDDGGCD